MIQLQKSSRAEAAPRRERSRLPRHRASLESCCSEWNHGGQDVDIRESLRQWERLASRTIVPQGVR